MFSFKNYKIVYPKEILINVIYYETKGLYNIIFYCASRKFILKLRNIFFITHDILNRTLYFTLNVHYKDLHLVHVLWKSYEILLLNTIKDFIFGYSLILEVRGVGYKVYIEQDTLILNLGFSHYIQYKILPDISIKILDSKNTVFSIKGFNRNLVHEIAAKIRHYKKPEPYKGKGICYANENVILKESKKNQ